MVLMDKKTTGNIIDQISKIREAANLLIERELAKRKIEGIVPAHGVVFKFLFQQKEPIPITTLVQKTGRAKSTVTGIVKTLERNGYIFKQPSREDGRSFHIGLTEKGWSIKSEFEEISDALNNRVYGEMPSENRDMLSTLLAKIEKNLG